MQHESASRRRAVVTGGAGGIGTEICRQLATAEVDVVVADIDLQAAERLASALPRACAMAVDLDNSAAVADFAEAMGPVDILVNNAGMTQVERFVDSDLDRWDPLYRLNLRAPMQLTKAVLPSMIERGWGRIVFISSDSARIGAGGESVYAAFKAGLLGFAKSVAREVARSNVTSNVVSPGPTDTPMHRAISAEHPKMQEALLKAIPMRRLGAPTDIAAAVAFLSSEDAGYVTGQTLSVSGGITMV